MGYYEPDDEPEPIEEEATRDVECPCGEPHTGIEGITMTCYSHNRSGSIYSGGWVTSGSWGDGEGTFYYICPKTGKEEEVTFDASYEYIDSYEYDGEY